MDGARMDEARACNPLVLCGSYLTGLARLCGLGDEVASLKRGARATKMWSLRVPRVG